MNSSPVSGRRGAGNDGALLGPGPRGFQEFAYHVTQFLKVNRLTEDARSSKLLGHMEKVESARPSTSRGGDDLDRWELPPQLPDRLQALLLGYEEIHDDEVCRGGAMLCNPLSAVARFHNLVSGMLHDLPEQVPNGGVIVNCQKRAIVWSFPVSS